MKRRTRPSTRPGEPPSENPNDRAPCAQRHSVLDRVASLRAARGTSTYLRQKKREEQVLDLLQVSEEESSSSKFPALEEETSSESEREETPARRRQLQGPVVWQWYVQPGEVVDLRLANEVPVVRSCGVANQGPAPRSERQSARPGHKWQHLRRVEGASRRMRERRTAREREEQRAARAPKVAAGCRKVVREWCRHLLSSGQPIEIREVKAMETENLLETTEVSDFDFSVVKIFEELDSEVRMRARIMQLRVPDAEGDSSSEEVDV